MDMVTQKFQKDDFDILLYSKQNSTRIYLKISKHDKLLFDSLVEIIPHKIFDVKGDSVFLDYYVIDDEYIKHFKDYTEFKHLANSIVLVKRYQRVDMHASAEVFDVDSISEKNRILYMFSNKIMIDSINLNHLEYRKDYFFSKYYSDKRGLYFKRYYIRDKEFIKRYEI